MNIKEALQYIRSELELDGHPELYSGVYEDFVTYLKEGYGPEAAAESALWVWEVETNNGTD